MRLLFAITVCCFCVVLWVALALARRIRLGQVLTAKPNPKPVRIPPAREFFEAGEFRTPRPLHLDQEIFKQKPRRRLADFNLGFGHHAPLAANRAGNQVASQADAKIGGVLSAEPDSFRSSPTPYATLFGQNVSIAQIKSGTDVRGETSTEAGQPGDAAGRPAFDGSLTSLPVDVTRRIPPQPDRASGLRRRVDLSHFNKDLGDLTDPYTTPFRGSGTLGPATSGNIVRAER